MPSPSMNSDSCQEVQENCLTSAASFMRCTEGSWSKEDCSCATVLVEWMEGHVSAKLTAIEKKLDVYAAQIHASPAMNMSWDEHDDPSNPANFSPDIASRPRRMSLAMKLHKAASNNNLALGQGSAELDEVIAAELETTSRPRAIQGRSHSVEIQDDEGVNSQELGFASPVMSVNSWASGGRNSWPGMARHISMASVDSGQAQLNKIRQTIQEHKSAGFPEQKNWTAWMWQFMDNPYSSRGAYLYSIFVPLFVGFSVLVSFLQSIENTPLKGASGEVMQTIFESFFAIELIVRFVACPDRRNFFLSIFNWIDLISALPLVLRITFHILDVLAANSHSQEVLSVIAVVPLLRLMKLTRRFEKFQLLLSAFKIAIEALPVLLYTLMLIALIFSALIYFAEQDNLASLPTALWFTIVTMTTVGYGDVTPKTTWGHLIAAVLMIISALYMAIPIGIVGNAFSQVWGDRDRLLLMQRMRHAFLQGGFTPAAIAEIFALFDTDGSGELDIAEFCVMLKVMQINIGKERVFQLFEDFDKDGVGCISLHKLMNGLFPHSSSILGAFPEGRTSGGERGSR